MKLIVSIFALFLVQVAFTQEAPAKKQEVKKSCCVSKSVKSENGKASAGEKKDCCKDKKACESKKSASAENVKASAGEKKDCCKDKKSCDTKKCASADKAKAKDKKECCKDKKAS